MDEKKQLQISFGHVAPNRYGNPRGRPCKVQSMNYGHKPKSIVSQILEEMVNANRITIPIEANIHNSLIIEEQNNHKFKESIDLEEAHQSEEYNILCEEPKKSCKSKRESLPKKIYICDFTKCTYSSKLSSNLEKHKRTHTGEKPYLCDRCSFRTSFSNSLKVHRRLHTKERPYQCKHCNYKCNSISNLKKHGNSKHKDILSTTESIQLPVTNGAEKT